MIFAMVVVTRVAAMSEFQDLFVLLVVVVVFSIGVFEGWVFVLLIFFSS